MPPRSKTANAVLADNARAQKLAPMPLFKPRRRPGGRLLLKPAVLDKVPFSYPTIWSWMRAGSFPRSVTIGGRVGWYESEIEDWLASLKRTSLKGDEAAA